MYLVTGLYSSKHENRHNNFSSFAKSFSPATFFKDALCLIYVNKDEDLKYLETEIFNKFKENVKDIDKELEDVKANLENAIKTKKTKDEISSLFRSIEQLEKQKNDMFPMIPEELYTPKNITPILIKDVNTYITRTDVYPQSKVNDTVMLYIDKVNDYDDFNEEYRKYKIIEKLDNNTYKLTYNTYEKILSLNDFYIVKLSEESKKEIQASLESEDSKKEVKSV